MVKVAVVLLGHSEIEITEEEEQEDEAARDREAAERANEKSEVCDR